MKFDFDGVRIMCTDHSYMISQTMITDWKLTIVLIVSTFSLIICYEVFGTFMRWHWIHFIFFEQQHNMGGFVR